MFYVVEFCLTKNVETHCYASFYVAPCKDIKAIVRNHMTSSIDIAEKKKHCLLQVYGVNQTNY